MPAAKKTTKKSDKPKRAPAKKAPAKKKVSKKPAAPVSAPLSAPEKQQVTTQEAPLEKTTSVSTAPEVVTDDLVSEVPSVQSTETDQNSAPQSTEPEAQPEPADADTAAAAQTPTEPVESPAATPKPAPTTAPSPVTARPRRRKRGLILSIAVCVLLLAAAAAIYQVKHRKPADVATRTLIGEVSQRAVLPRGEMPTVTTVVDASKANQAFLQNAKNGDKVLLYFQSGRAVLYRPSTHQIVNMGPLTQPPAKVFLRDGASGDIPSYFSDKLSQTAGFTVVSRDAAASRNYKQTIVIDLHGNRPDLAKKVAELVGGKVSNLPANETSPDADIMVIRGSDAK